MNKDEKNMLKKLSRQDLLEMLLESERYVKQLEEELEEARKQLDDRRIMIENSGSIAEAALKLNGIFEAAQAAADQYLENLENKYSDIERKE
ncbi:MAG: DNA repair protein [Oliverpabstia intestinalis]|nr:DNA repair protein [Oliverpabstia intestinalis]MDD6411153.1 DNA repair protein [Oliverpabstia intestinalis]